MKIKKQSMALTTTLAVISILGWTLLASATRRLLHMATDNSDTTTTTIKHVVVLFQENVSFDPIISARIRMH